MINVVILEDEAPAIRKLKRFLDGVKEDTAVVAEFSTVADAIRYLKLASNIDLILSDIELLDGNAFEIFSEVTPSVPIIFTTAYNQFLMEAFETNGIEYLLKPFSFERFQKSWRKFLLLRTRPLQEDDLLKKLGQLIDRQSQPNGPYKRRFTVHNHRCTSFIEVDKIAFFLAEEGVVVAVDCFGKKHLLTYSTLKEIDEQLDPSQFFRINRRELVSKLYIEHIERYSKNSISIKLQGYPQHLITSQSASSQFREWIEQ
jgi:Response regulator of the LytR/AlgR family